MSADRTGPRSSPDTTSEDDWLDAALAADAREHGASYLDDQGFTYCPAGVSTGPIAWRDVTELRDITVTVGGSGYGPEPLPALAVVLRDPEAYHARFPALLRPLLQARQGLSGTSLVIDLNHLGPRRAEVRAAMEAHISRSQG